jgi:catechol 2,3-dioxygenase-like lactoylglutathione lyase family enzyme
VSLQHVTLELSAAQVADCIAFYELLGFTRVDPPESLLGRAEWLQSGSTQIHLMPVEDPVQLPEGHVAVVVEDYDGLTARLSSAGREPDPRTEHWGSPRSFVRDPAGNRVELMQFAPPGP